MTTSSNPNPDRAALSARFARAASASETPESMGRAIHRYILTEGANKGELSADGKAITIPLTVTLHVPGTAERKSSVGWCISSFGYDLICIKGVAEVD